MAAVERWHGTLPSGITVSVMSGESGVLLHGSEVKKEALDPPPTPVVSTLLDYPADSPYSPSTTTTISKEREYGDDEKSPKCVYDTSMSPSSPDHQYCSSTTQFIGDSCYPMLEGSTREDESPKRLCLVCNDIASGLHYGVASCEACKAFFKRTIQGNIEYTCPASNDCEINKRRRKACQACRFQKCLRMGMLKEGVRLDRVRGGRQKYRRNPEPPYQIQTIPIKKPSLENNKLLVALIACEQESVMASPQQGLRDNEFKTISTLSNLADKELVTTIGWAKQIPGFAELTLNDQMKLLQSTWAEVLSLSVAFRSVGAGPKVLQYAPDFAVSEKQAKECKAEELFQQTLAIANRLEAANVAKEEFYLLKAFLLANSDTRVEQPSILRKLRDAILTSLTEASAALRSSNPTYRVYTLLSILPCVRQVDATMRRFWIGVRRAGRINMNKLLVEMLEASVR